MVSPTHVFHLDMTRDKGSGLILHVTTVRLHHSHLWHIGYRVNVWHIGYQCDAWHVTTPWVSIAYQAFLAALLHPLDVFQLGQLGSLDRTVLHVIH